ncbi:MAG: ATP-binding cassette domain-containing protein [Lachnospiraceae bacterium]
MEKEALLEVRSLSVRYPGNKKEVLHQVDLTLAPGAITSVIGESGSGKSTPLQANPAAARQGRDHRRRHIFRGQRLHDAGDKAAHHCGSGGCVVVRAGVIELIRKIGRQFYDAPYAHDRSITRAETQKGEDLRF